jgi:hypothetical protein
MQGSIPRDRTRGFEVVARCLEDARGGSAHEAVALLREILTGPPGPGGSAEDFRLWEAGTITFSMLVGSDRSGAATEGTLVELDDAGAIPLELRALLRRMLDRDAPDRIASIDACLRELDAVAASLPAAEARSRAVPAEPPAPTPAERDQRSFAKLGCFALVGGLALLLVYEVASESAQQSDPTPTSFVAGTTIEVLTPEELARLDPTWASEAQASSNGAYADRLVGRPEVFPEARNAAYAWYASRDDRGTEWVVVSWNIPWEVEQIVVLETFHPGAIVAVDDVEDFDENRLGAARFARLWSGTTPVVEGSRALVLRLAEPRRIAALRLVLDTARAPGSNQIDAVGVVAPR